MDTEINGEIIYVRCVVVEINFQTFKDKHSIRN